MKAVEVENLNHAYGSKTVLAHLNLSVEAGEIFGLLGPNGGGKTTLFRILSTLLTPSRGKAFIFGQNVVQNADAVRQKIGVVFQNPSLDKKLTLEENLVHQGHLYGLTGSLLKSRIREVLNRLSLHMVSSTLVEHLSGGLQRRGEIAKGLLHRPELLLMDEPSTGLDPSARRELWTFLKDLKKEGITILLTTHLMEEGEECQHLAILHQGHRVALGTPDELKKKIGGDVISIQSKDPAKLARLIQDKFGLKSLTFNGTIRIEKEDGHKFIPQLAESFPGFMEAVTVGKPTLEDVFVTETGKPFSP